VHVLFRLTVFFALKPRFMKRYFPVLILLATIPLLSVEVAGQVVNYAKTLPERSFSIGLTPAWHFNNGLTGLRNLGIGEEEPGTFSVAATGGHALNYSMDLGVKYMYTYGGKHYFGVDLQYLVHEARQTYFSVVAGLHRWDGYGVDLTGLFTWSPRYFLNFSTGLDLDVDYFPSYLESGDSKVGTRFWLPLNVGFNANETAFIYLEYDLNISEWAWGIVALGVNIVIR
jgi:hypothetical protein